MSQKTINSFFAVRKRPVNQQAAKSRKLEKSQDVHSSVITTFKDDHVIPSQPTNDFHVSKKEDSNSPFTELVKSQEESILLATPSTSTSDQKLKASNSRSRK